MAFQANLILSAIDELHADGQLDNKLQQISKQHPERRKRNKNKNTNKNKNKRDSDLVVPLSYCPSTQRTVLQNQKLLLYCSALNASHTKHTITPDEVILVFDSGASCTISPSESDFYGTIHKVQNTKISGIADGLEIKGTGTVEYTLKDDSGNDVRVRIKNALYIPQCPVRLICPQQLAD